MLLSLLISAIILFLELEHPAFQLLVLLHNLFDSQSGFIAAFLFHLSQALIQRLLVLFGVPRSECALALDEPSSALLRNGGKVEAALIIDDDAVPCREDIPFR